MEKIFKILIIFVFVFSFSVAQADSVSVHFIIRNGGELIWQGDVVLPDAGFTSITDSASNTHNVDTRSILAVLNSIDVASDAFSISNLTYYDSFGSFYLKCLTSGTGEACDNWQYAVANTNPSQSIDKYILGGGESVGIYFGNNHRIEVPTTQIFTNQEFIVVAEKYDYSTNSWSAFSGVTIGVTLPNTVEPWNPKVINIYPTEAEGKTKITINTPDTYNLGIVEDYYFPLFPIKVDPKPEPKTEAGSGGNWSGGTALLNPGGEVLGASVKKEESLPIDIHKLVTFLTSKQNKDGSFGGASIYADWVAVALGSLPHDEAIEAKEKLREYLKNDNKIFTNITDNLRRAMAILALNENPYTFSEVNYIKPIVDSFDGEQLGDKEYINDDIFALLVLSKAGYSLGDKIIDSEIKYLLSKQNKDGNFAGSVDLTAAAILAFVNYKELPEVHKAIDLAEQYIKEKQVEDGGWGNAYSTAWVLGAMDAVSENWLKNNKSGVDYLALLQAKDGGILEEKELLDNRIWASGYVLPVFMNKNWNEILNTFPKYEPTVAVEKTEIKTKKTKQKSEEFVRTSKLEINHNVTIDQTPDEKPVAPKRSIFYRFFQWLFNLK